MTSEFNFLMKIYSLQAREILDSAGNPTVEAKLMLANGSIGTGSVPSGASTGSGEAFELRDGDLERFSGKGVLRACDNILTKITPAIVGKEFSSQADFDHILIEIDGTSEKSNLGANAVLAVSIAFARAVADAKNIQLFESLERDATVRVSTSETAKLPKPMMVLIEGGKHADNSTDFQEYLIKPDGIKSAKEQIRACQEVRLKLADILKAQRLSTNVGLEGAFAPDGIANNQKPLEFISEAISNAGYKVRDEISIGIDVAASEFWQSSNYQLPTANSQLNSKEMVESILDLVKKYPISSIEDGLSEKDQSNWPELNRQLTENNCLLIGDDLTVTKPQLIEKFAKNGSIGGVVIKINQIGTISETVEAARAAKDNNLQIIVSHRGSETIDTTLVDLAVAIDADYIKVGPTRGERVCKYNRLMEIEEMINK